MKALILAAGYGTRLYPLTKDTPKPLLKIKEKAILEYILNSLEEVRDIDEVYLITNNLFYEKFFEWAKNYKGRVKIDVINDGTTSNENRLGAVRDIEFVLKKKHIKDDILVAGGDNLFDLDLKDFTGFALTKRPHSIVSVCDINYISKAHLYGIVKIDEEDRIVGFEEKPKEPKSTLAAMALYFFPKEVLNLISCYLKEEAQTDAPGFFIKWLSVKDKVFAYIFNGHWFDIGSIDSYEQAQEVWEKEIKE